MGYKGHGAGSGSGDVHTRGQLECHLWLNLMGMPDAEKVRFLDITISQGSLFSNTVEDFAQQFSTVKKQTGAIKHILPRRGSASTSTLRRLLQHRHHMDHQPDQHKGPHAGRWHWTPINRL